MLILTAVAYPIVVHAAVVLKHAPVGFAVLLAVLLIHLFIKAKSREGRGHRSMLRVILLGMCMVVGLIAVAVRWDPVHALFLPPILINSFLLILFGRSLLSSHEPLIARLSRLERGTLPPELVTYTRRVTWVWTGFFAGSTIESVLLASYASLEVWSLFTNILNYVFIAALFIAEYIYRIMHFPKYNHTPPLRLAVNIARHGFGLRVLS